MLAELHSERFVDQVPAAVYAALLDEGRYLCSERTMYRVLAAADEVRERRDQLRHPAYVKPELLTTRANEVWSWDITKLLTPATVHYGETATVLAGRREILTAAYVQHPERFVRRAPQPAEPPKAVWINPPKPSDANGDLQ